jgi:hypothetical protein
METGNQWLEGHKDTAIPGRWIRIQKRDYLEKDITGI